MLEAHRDPLSMAKVLVQYIADPYEVYRQVRREFGSCPGISKIRELREAYFREEDEEPISWKVEADRYVAHMERANIAFLNAVAASHPHKIRKAA